ncbi:hypothetical protein AB9B48_17020 [Kluyvera ascorbata]|uniref:hypothetical protein n=1 Tax=Kluyvera ascorbata TaxID=51288 RepID=UPI00351078E8
MIRLVVIVERRDFKPCVGTVAGQDVGNTDKDLFQPLLYEGVGLNPPAVLVMILEIIMLKRQPSVCAGDYTDVELYQWMQQKAQSFNQLELARDRRELLLRELDDVDKQISELASAASLKYFPHCQMIIHPDVDERTARDVSVLIYLLKKPTGDAVKDAENAALADMYSTALKGGKVVGFISDDAPGVVEARKELGQIS